MTCWREPSLNAATHHDRDSFHWPQSGTSKTDFGLPLRALPRDGYRFKTTLRPPASLHGRRPHRQRQGAPRADAPTKWSGRRGAAVALARQRRFRGLCIAFGIRPSSGSVGEEFRRHAAAPGSCRSVRSRHRRLRTGALELAKTATSSSSHFEIRRRTTRFRLRRGHEWRMGTHTRHPPGRQAHYPPGSAHVRRPEPRLAERRQVEEGMVSTRSLKPASRAAPAGRRWAGVGLQSVLRPDGRNLVIRNASPKRRTKNETKTRCAQLSR